MSASQPSAANSAAGAPAVTHGVPFLQKPLDIARTVERVAEELGLSQGHIEGITLYSFLQVLAQERKTCKLAIYAKAPNGITCTGVLALEAGDLVHASSGPLEGPEAMFEILGWASPRIDIRKSSAAPKRNLTMGLMELLMEAARMKDEADMAAGSGRPARRSMSPSARPAPVTVRLPTMAAGKIDPTTANPHTTTETTKETMTTMSNLSQSLEECMKIDGALAVALVDAKSGMAMGTAGGGVNLEVAAAGNSEVVRAKLKTMQNLGLKDRIEDILITLGAHYHIIRPLASTPTIFMYLVLNRASSNLAMARHKLTDIESKLSV